MKDKKNKKTSPLGIFAILSSIVAVAASVILILHNTYGFFA